HHLRDHRLPPRPRLPELDPDRRRPRRRRHRGPPDRRALAHARDARPRRGGRGGRRRMNILVPALIALPALAAGISMAFWRRILVQQLIGIAVLGACLAGAAYLVLRVATEGPVAVHLGGWPAPIGITLVVDLLAALLLAMSLAAVVA